MALDCASPGYCVCAETRVPGDLEGRREVILFGEQIKGGKFGKVSMVVFYVLICDDFLHVYCPRSC